MSCSCANLSVVSCCHLTAKRRGTRGQDALRNSVSFRVTLLRAVIRTDLPVKVPDRVGEILTSLLSKFPFNDSCVSLITHVNSESQISRIGSACHSDRITNQ